MVAVALLSLIASQDAVDVVDLRIQRPLPVQTYEVRYVREDHGPPVSLVARVEEHTVESAGGLELWYQWVDGAMSVNGRLSEIKVVDGPAAPSARAVDDLLGRLTTYTPPTVPLAIGDGWRWDSPTFPPVRVDYQVREVATVDGDVIAVVEFNSREHDQANPATATGQFHVSVASGRAIACEAKASNLFFYDRRSAVSVAGQRVK